ncbi:MAG: FixH family protein [Pseudomonadota bacterium]|nr:FixH family protein [Pseudomonadota bacterium]
MERTAPEQHKLVSAWRSPWVLGWIALVLAVLAVNLTMVFFAISTNPGLVVDDYYERGKDYERTMASKMARDPGWVMRADIPTDIRAGERSTVRFFVVDKAGQPVTPDAVRFFAYRPSDASQDFTVDVTEEGEGRYVSEVTFPLAGIWDTLLSATNGNDEFNLGKRIHVQRP